MKKVKTEFLSLDRAFSLQNAPGFGPVTLAYETYGTLSPSGDNAILLFHALSGSQHAAGCNPLVPGVGSLWNHECHTGWWNGFVGPGKALDTSQFFIICANYIGGCYGSTGPTTLDPSSKIPYGGSFPWITANDIVDSQICLLDHLGIKQLHAVVGSSLGGMLALNLSVRYPNRVRIVVPLAAGASVTILQLIHNFEQICAIEKDPNFNGGNYYDGPFPEKGLSLARMISHKTFVSLWTLARRARREMIDSPDGGPNGYRLTHPVESYMLHQARKFVKRFDANTYLRIMNLWQNFNLVRDARSRSLLTLFNRCRNQHFLVFSIDSDVCFYPEEQEQLVRTLEKSRVPSQHITVHSEKGHDAFLLEPGLFTPHLVYTLQGRW